MAYLWVSFVVVFGKDQRCEKKNNMRVVKGKFYQKFPKTLVFVLGHNLAYEPPSWMILVGDEP